MSVRHTYAWSVACAWGLTIAVGALTVSGVLAMFLRLDAPWPARLHDICVISFACVAGLALANANNAAAAAMHAAMHRRFNWPTFIPAMICACIFCFASVIGVHLGWETMASGAASAEMPTAFQVVIAAALLAFAKPAMSWVLEGRRAMDREDSDAADREEAERLDAIRKADIASRSANVTRLPVRPHRIAAGAAALALGASIGAPHEATEAAPMVQMDAPQPGMSEAPQKRPQAQGRRVQKKQADYDARVAAARQMLAQAPRLSNRGIARETRLSASTVDRLAREMTPMREQAA